MNICFLYSKRKGGRNFEENKKTKIFFIIYIFTILIIKELRLHRPKKYVTYYFFKRLEYS